MSRRNEPSWAGLGLDELIRQRPASSADELRRKANAARDRSDGSCGEPTCDIPWHWPAAVRARIAGAAWFRCRHCHTVFVVGPKATTSADEEARACRAHETTCERENEDDL